jgi:hypothetical protein
MRNVPPVRFVLGGLVEGRMSFTGVKRVLAAAALLAAAPAMAQVAP